MWSWEVLPLGSYEDTRSLVSFSAVQKTVDELNFHGTFMSVFMHFQIRHRAGPGREAHSILRQLLPGPQWTLRWRPIDARLMSLGLPSQTCLLFDRSIIELLTSPTR